MILVRKPLTIDGWRTLGRSYIFEVIEELLEKAVGTDKDGEVYYKDFYDLDDLFQEEINDYYQPGLYKVRRFCRSRPR